MNLKRVFNSLLSEKGELSSKRVMGILIVIVSLGWGTWFMINKETRDVSAESLIEWVLSAGVALLGGAGIVDRINKTKNTE